MDIEEAFTVSGTLGKYQIFLTLISFFGNIVNGSQLLIMVVAGAVPNSDVPSEKNLTTIVTEVTALLINIPFWQLPLTYSQWNLQNDLWVISLLGSLFLLGYMFGSIVFGQLPDLYGRKPILIINSTLASITCFCSALCQNWKTFAVARFIGGCFVGGAVAPAFAIMCELIGKEYWGKIGMLYQTFFSLGVMLLGPLGYMFKNWRYVTMASSALSACVLPFYIFVLPESPRWLYSTGSIEKAEKIMRNLARKNGHDDSEINLEKPEESCSNAEDFTKHSVVDLLKSCSLVQMLVAASGVWFACSLSYYGLTADAGSLMPNIYLAIVLSGAVEIPAYIITLFLIDSKWFGRNGTMVLLLLGSGLASSCILFTGGANESTILKIVLGLTSKLCVAAAFSAMYIYISELFPTQVRTVALVIGNSAARLGGLIAFFLPLLGNAAFFLPYAIFGGVNVIAGAVATTMPETRGKRIVTMSDFVKSSPIQRSRNGSTQINAQSEADDQNPLLDTENQ